MREMNITVKVISFGAISGLIWAVIAGILCDLLFQSNKESIEVIIAGLLTGVIVSLVLKPSLKKAGKSWTIIVGLFSLPFGAFVFGFIFSILNPSGYFIDSQYGFSNALQVAVEYAILSVISIFVIVLLQLSVLTTFVLRQVIQSHRKSAN
jgi:uncharacterized membrane protein